MGAVPAVPAAVKMRLRLRLPPRSGSGPDEVSILIRGDRTIEYLRPRICNILDARTLDAYLTWTVGTSLTRADPWSRLPSRAAA